MALLCEGITFVADWHVPQSSTSLVRMMKQVFWAMGSGKSTAPWMMVNSTRSTFSAPGRPGQRLRLSFHTGVYRRVQVCSDRHTSTHILVDASFVRFILSFVPWRYLLCILVSTVLEHEHRKHSLLMTCASCKSSSHDHCWCIGIFHRKFT